MKKIIISLLLSSLFTTNCDKVPPRIPPPIPDCILDSSVMVVNTNTATSNTRKVLLEDYTGHLCGNCPTAVLKADELSKKHGNKLVVIANHSSDNFAQPKKNSYLEDFRDAASIDWDVFFGMSQAGLPRGSVNRTLLNGKYPQAYSTWETTILKELNKPQTVKLDVTTSYDPSQKILNVHVLSTFKADLSFNVNLTLLLIQDSIIGDQIDYNPPGDVQIINGRRPDFVFNHIMVKSLNGSWGERIKAAPIAVNDTATVVKDCKIISKCFYKNEVCTNDKNMYLVVLVTNESTYEVLQVEKVKLMKSAE